MKHGRLAVLEVNWEKEMLQPELSSPFRSFLGGLEAVLDEDFPEGTFNTGEDFRKALREFGRSSTKYLYVCAHGCKKQIIADNRGVNS